MKKLLLTGLAALTIGCAANIKQANIEKIMFQPNPYGYSLEIDTNNDGKGDTKYFFEVMGINEYGYPSELRGYCVDKNKNGTYENEECVKIEPKVKQ